MERGERELSKTRMPTDSWQLHHRARIPALSNLTPEPTQDLPVPTAQSGTRTGSKSLVSRQLQNIHPSISCGSGWTAAPPPSCAKYWYCRGAGTESVLQSTATRHGVEARVGTGTQQPLCMCGVATLGTAMDPLSVPISPTAPSPDTPIVQPETESFAIPELSDSDYTAEVLRLPLGKTEAQADQELVAKANAAGIAATLPSVASKRHPASSCSVSSFGTQQERTFSNASNGSASTALTPHSSVFGPPSSLFDSGSGERRGSTTSLTFSHYERYISSIDSVSNPHKPPKAPPAVNDDSARSVTSVSSKKGHRVSIKDRLRWKRKTIEPVVASINLISKAVQHESQMPPRCCSQPIAAPLVRSILSQDAQETFLLAVLKLSTPVDERVFCPDSTCGHFIPPHDAHDPKHPFDLTCFKCNGRVCAICKGAAHPIGEDCPQDWELAVLKKKQQQQQQDKGSWKRCYECRALVESNEESPYMTCRCKARFCSVCVAIWDPTTGCPNLCSFEEELERRRQMKTAAAPPATEQRLRANSSIQRLGQEQQEELRRFMDYKSQGKDALQTRHLVQEAALEEKYEYQEEKLRERQERSLSQLEDRHVSAEMELLETLHQDEQNIHRRLKHMEAYCNGLGRNPNSSAPVRVVTERDLRELGQQYHLRDGMDRMRESKINLMRERQAMQIEELRAKQQVERTLFTEKRHDELDRLEARFVQEETHFNGVFEARQSRLQSRWVLAIEVLCKELEEQNPSQVYRRIATPRWPDERLFQDRKASDRGNVSNPAIEL
ncbi:ibr domain-containing [Trichoderma arundinaceum]|uniref:RBR-type E3 ubiquitin transferase n=1 Tax=Trichoderma arundinaceum TaxID=490622 RepID=A0A395NI85_TRIAR|nr:ibr domain-containing [Trichoderma arundinaceum]